MERRKNYRRWINWTTKTKLVELLLYHRLARSRTTRRTESCACGVSNRVTLRARQKTDFPLCVIGQEVPQPKQASKYSWTPLLDSPELSKLLRSHKAIFKLQRKAGRGKSSSSNPLNPFFLTIVRSCFQIKPSYFELNRGSLEDFRHMHGSRLERAISGAS